MGLFWKSFEPSNDLLDLSGKVALVTGGNAGIGFWTVYHLAKRGAKVFLGARNETKAKAAIAKMQSMGGVVGEIEFVEIKLDDPRQVKQSASTLTESLDHLDIVVCNAGIHSSDYIETKDGIVDGMVVNHLGHFVLVETLLPVLEKTARERNSDVRVIALSSSAHSFINLSDVAFDSIASFNQKFEKSWRPSFSRYAQAKLANILWIKELQRRFEAKKLSVICISLHPGLVLTDMAAQVMKTMPLSSVVKFVISFIALQPEQGSYTSLFAAASPLVRQKPELYRGSYLVPEGKITATSTAGNDPELARVLWETSEEILKDTYGL